MVTTTYQTVRQKGLREDLNDDIADISPEETPFYSTISEAPPATAVKVEWQTDALATASATGLVEGADATYLTATPTARIGNYLQINGKAVIVSETASAVKAAGRAEELAYQVAKRGRELKRDLETALTNNRASNAGASATARAAASFEAWITTNDLRNGTSGTAGVQGGYTAAGTVSAATDAGTTGALTFTETRLKSVIKMCWAAGGQPTTVMVGPVNKRKASAFSGITTKYTDYGNNASSSEGLLIVGAADLYLSDFGKLQIVPNRFSRERSALVIDWKYWKMCWLRKIQLRPLSKTGDAEKRQLICEWTLISRNEAASGIIADMTTT